MTRYTDRGLPVRTPAMKLARGTVRTAAAALGGLMLLGVTSALAVSLLLPPGGVLATPPTTAATEPDLPGVVVHDTLVPFTIKTQGGAALCAGYLQDRVVRSTKSGQFHFYYRIRNTRGPGAIGRMVTASFATTALRVAYRTDGLGMVPPRIASRSIVPGALVTFELTDPPLSCAQHQESRFILIKTSVTAFHPGGATRIFATTGDEAAVPTVQP